MVGYARAQGLTPKTFPYAEAQRIYRETVAGHADAPAELPLSEQAFRDTLDPVAIVRNRATKGGPQPAEMAVMLAAARGTLQENAAWARERRARLAAAEKKLDTAFDRLLAE